MASKNIGVLCSMHSGASFMGLRWLDAFLRGIRGGVGGERLHLGFGGKLGKAIKAVLAQKDVKFASDVLIKNRL